MQKSVFVVEDHPLMREMLAELIAESGDLHLGGVASSGEDALEAMEAARPDLVLIDFSLPGMSGIDLVARVRQRWPAIPSVVLSGYAEKAYAIRAVSAGASGFVVKGNPNEIVDAIRRVLRGETFMSPSLREDPNPPHRRWRAAGQG